MLNSKTLSAMSTQLEKLGEDKKPPHPLATAGKALGSYALGTGAGYLGVMGANELSKHLAGQPLVRKGGAAQHLIPALTGAATLAFNHAQNRLFKKLDKDIEGRRAHDRKDS